MVPRFRQCNKIWLVIMSLMMLVSIVGCGISQQDYDELKTQLRTEQARTTELEHQIQQLRERYQLVGETPADTAQRIVKHYHETHIYSNYDLFVCGDMAVDVWDMLKAHDIDALIQIGDVEKDIKDIRNVSHAWVMAEVFPGQYLALETTGGYVVRKSDNPLYYQGWSFDNPRKYKRFAELRYELNTKVAMIEELTLEQKAVHTAHEQAVAEYHGLTNELEGLYSLDPDLADKLAEIIVQAEECGSHRGRYENIERLVNELTSDLEDIVSEMRGLVG